MTTNNVFSYNTYDFPFF